MKSRLNRLQNKTRLSAVIFGWTMEVLEKFRKETHLPTRSSAVAAALVQWAKDYEKSSRIDRALAKYGPLYRKNAACEETHARRFLPAAKQTRNLP